jgi:hypothetical protein
MRSALEGAPETLEQLYLRCKSLTLAVGAGLLLGRVEPGLVEETQELLDASVALTHMNAGAPLQPQFEVLLAAVRDLNELAGRSSSGVDSISTDQLEGARATHRAARRGVWEIVPCEYVPCKGTHVAGTTARADRT